MIVTLSKLNNWSVNLNWELILEIHALQISNIQLRGWSIFFWLKHFSERRGTQPMAFQKQKGSFLLPQLDSFRHDICMVEGKSGGGKSKRGSIKLPRWVYVLNLIIFVSAHRHFSI